MMDLFFQVSGECSRLVTERYSTSFSSAIRLLHKDLREPVYHIYGFVRFADEIVDTFHQYDKPALLAQFKKETYEAIERGISLNPILNSFQRTVRDYQVDLQLVDAFFHSMEMDLTQTRYNSEGYAQYIYGSAEVVGLMCLYVFCEGKRELYLKLEPYARSLGAAFQKVNFLRDMKADYLGLSRVYFPGCNLSAFTPATKQAIEVTIQDDFRQAYKGIVHLPLKARFGVYVAYKYYLSLFRKIKKLEPAHVLQSRVRIPNYYKLMIVLRAGVKNQLRMIE
jgi:phytoene/squalene synthetase